MKPAHLPAHFSLSCSCDRCCGTGEIECPDCGGQGTWRGSIEDIPLTKEMFNYEELRELQKDAKRVISQASQLKAMNPCRADSYEEQLRGCLFIINSQAEKAAEPDGRVKVHL